MTTIRTTYYVFTPSKSDGGESPKAPCKTTTDLYHFHKIFCSLEKSITHLRVK